MPSKRASQLYDAVADTVRAMDRVLRDAAEHVLSAIPDRDARVDYTLRMRVLDETDSAARSLFGVQGVAIDSSLVYRTIQAHSETVFVGLYRSGLGELDDIMKPYPWWDDAKKFWMNAPISAIERDDLATAYRMLYGPHVDQQRLLNAKLFDRQRRWVDPNGYRLSDRIWKQGNTYRNAIDRMVQQGIREGWSADRLARELRGFVDPANAPLKYMKSGRIFRVGNTFNPNAANSARRLARTEISNVHALGTIDRGRDLPGLKGIKFNLSASHPADDECNPNADRDLFGLGAGVYPIDQVPQCPTHPNCMCYLTHVMRPREEVRAEIVEKYRGIFWEDAA